jgi:hypothetical protein
MKIMTDAQNNSNQSSANDSDESILNEIRPMVLLLLGLLLGIVGNMFVNALFFGIDTLPPNLQFTIVALGLASGVFCILLLYLDIHPSLKKIKNYPKTSNPASTLLFIFFIIVCLVIAAYGFVGTFAPQNSPKICQNITYVVNNYYQNYTVNEVNEKNKGFSFSIDELKYLVNSRGKS